MFHSESKTLLYVRAQKIYVCYQRRKNNVWTMKIIYNYGLHEKLISIIIKLREGYFPDVRGKITLSRFNNYGY